MGFEAQLLETQGDYSLVSWEGRRFPGLTIQGDSLHLLKETLQEAEAELSNRNIDDALFAVREALEKVESMESAYGQMMAKRGMKLPY
ncbi:DUF6959 family protein [Nocardia sp. IFM 10818]